VHGLTSLKYLIIEHENFGLSLGEGSCEFCYCQRGGHVDIEREEV
jgi:hypothetical protein